ncbi:MAG: PadR family transcriptional regulator [Actinobacteria bacterium]|nr:PadR family transcriptional regulator [Actinomycetota bacterium]
MSEKIDNIANHMLGEWKRAMLTYWTLSLLVLHSMYGLEIKKEIEESTERRLKLGISTIYQLLRRLEKKGLVKSRWEQTSMGPPRAYYEITETGKTILKIYVSEVLSPGSPIYNAIGKLTEKMILKLNEVKK